MKVLEVQSLDSEAVVIRIGPYLDFRSAASLQRACQEQVRWGHKHLILDFTGTRMLDAAGLRAILLVHGQVEEVQGTLALSCMSGTVAFVTRLVRLCRNLPYFPTIGAALEAVEAALEV